MIWMRSVLWIRHLFALKYYCPPSPVSRPSNFHVQQCHYTYEAQQCCHSIIRPSSPAYPISEPKGQDYDRHTYSCGRGLISRPPYALRHVAHHQLLPPPFPTRRRTAAGTAAPTSCCTIAADETCACPSGPAVQLSSVSEGKYFQVA